MDLSACDACGPVRKCLSENQVMDYILLGKSPNAQMNFGKIFERKRADAAPRNAEEISKIKERIEKEDRAFEDELPAKYSLLQEFSEDELKKLCDQVLGARPPKEEFRQGRHPEGSSAV